MTKGKRGGKISPATDLPAGRQDSSRDAPVIRREDPAGMLLCPTNRQTNFLRSLPAKCTSHSGGRQEPMHTGNDGDGTE